MGLAMFAYKSDKIKNTPNTRHAKLPFRHTNLGARDLAVSNKFLVTRCEYFVR